MKPMVTTRSAAAILTVAASALFVLSMHPGAEPGPTPTNPAPADRLRDRQDTERMAVRLAAAAATNESMAVRNPYLSTQRVELLRKLLGEAEPPPDPQRLAGYELKLGRELLNDGQTNEAVEVLEALWTRIEGGAPPQVEARLRDEAHSLLAVAYLRRGEQENCVMHHGIDSCLLPIRGKGVHSEQRGSRAAIREYTSILEEHPYDLTSRWLLNIAYMTVGEYPDQVPTAWLIPPHRFASESEFPRFFDVSGPAGVAVNGLAGGAIFDDFDADGLLDLVASSWGLYDPLRFFHNRGDGTFEERTEAAGLDGIVGGLNVVHTDYDNDGDLDLFVPRGAWLSEHGRMPNSLLRNNGDGTFDDVTERAGLLSFHPTQVGAWGDYDDDGWIDLFVANETVRGGPPHPCQLYHNNGDGTFTDVAEAVGVAAVGFLKGATWGDYDNDGREDLYVTGLASTPSNLLFHNDGPRAGGGWSFTDRSTQAGVREPANSFPNWFFDYDNDGWLDIFVSGYRASAADVAADYLDIMSKGEKPRLYRNRGDGTFEDVTREMNLDKVLFTMGANFGDLDNDGWLDFYCGTGNPDFRTLVPNRMFRNAGGLTFQDVTTSGGFGHLQKGHGVSFADVDQDGDQDVFIKIGGAFPGDRFRSALFENPGLGNDWITLKLVGARSNRAAVGARIKVSIEGAEGPREIHVTVTSGSSFGGNSLQQEIGLGPSARIRRIDVTWPAGGPIQTLSNVAVNQALEIREGEPQPVALSRVAFDLSPDDRSPTAQAPTLLLLGSRQAPEHEGLPRRLSE